MSGYKRRRETRGEGRVPAQGGVSEGKEGRVEVMSSWLVRGYRVCHRFSCWTKSVLIVCEICRGCHCVERGERLCMFGREAREDVENKQERCL